MAGFPFILQLLFELQAGAAGGACGQAALKPVAIAEKMDNSRVSLFSYEATRVAFPLPYLGLTLRLGNGLVTKGPGGPRFFSRVSTKPNSSIARSSRRKRRGRHSFPFVADASCNG